MKRYIGILLLVGLTATAQGQTTQTEKTLRQEINRPIVKLVIAGRSAVQLSFDSVNYLDVVYDTTASDPLAQKAVTVQGMTLKINDTEGVDFYHVHLKKADLQQVEHSSRSTVLFPDEMKAKVVSESATGTTYANSEARANTLSDEGEHDTEEPESMSTTSPHYGFWQRSDFRLLWGATDWGKKWYSGFSSAVRGPATTFSSWQLEWQYALWKTAHWDLSAGVGFEWDHYKHIDNLIGTPLLGIETDSYNSFSLAATEVDWLRLVGLDLRYVNLPISVGYSVEKVRFGLTVVPGLLIGSEMALAVYNSPQPVLYDQYYYAANADLKAYKVDVRLEVARRFLGAFVQFSTVGMLRDPGIQPQDLTSRYYEPVYPIKAGIVLHL